MPKLRFPRFETADARLKFPPRKKPYFTAISRKISLGYRRNEAAGSWVVSHAGWEKRIATADDHEKADGRDILSWWQAVDRARALVRSDDASGEAGAPATVGEALDAHEADLISRDGDRYNAARVRIHCPPALLGRPVSLLT